MIILFDKNEKQFTSLGLGVLKDAISCVVVEELNGGFELEMEYPVSGNHYKDIQQERYIFAKPNMYDNPQPFKIYTITKPINGIVTVNAEHISYSMNGYTVLPFQTNNLNETLVAVQNGTALPSPFIFSTDKTVNTGMKVQKPYNQRALLAGQEGSILDTYKGEYKFDIFNIALLNHRGRDRGLTIRYGKNMTDLEQETKSDKLYTGIFPYYFQYVNETVTVTEKYYQEVYIVSSSRALESNWLSLSSINEDTGEGGSPLVPIIANVAVQIKTKGAYYNAVYWFTKAVQDVNLITSYIREGSSEYSNNWLSTIQGGAPLTPASLVIYRIVSEGDFFAKNYIWNGSSYEQYSSDGFYTIPDPIPEPGLIRVQAQTQEKEVYLDLTTDSSTTNGVIYVEGQENTVPQKILTLDLTEEFIEEPTKEVLKAKAVDYLKNNNLREVTESLTVSFIKLSDSKEYEQFKNLEIVELGDTVYVIFEALNVQSKLEVISTTFNVILERYDEIELGTKKASIGDTAVTTGDGISSLTNDANYTDQIYVVDLIADSMKVVNADITNAVVKNLQVEKLRVPGLIEASYADIDTLVAQLLVAENAEVTNALTAGSIEVKGKIIALSGEIGGCTIDEYGNLVVSTSIAIGDYADGNYTFQVDTDGNVLAKSLTLKGGMITLGEYVNGDYTFQVTNDGQVIAQSLNLKGGKITLGKTDSYEDVFSVDENGVLFAKKATIQGTVTVTSGSIMIGGWGDDPTNYNFTVDENGVLFAKKATIQGTVNITSGSIMIGTPTDDSTGYNFTVDSDGNMTGRGTIEFGSFRVQDGVASASGFTIQNGVQGSTSSVNINPDGTLKALNATISGMISAEQLDVFQLRFEKAITMQILNVSGTTETQQVNVQYHTTSDGVEIVKIPVGTGEELWCHVWLDKALWYNQQISVTYSYAYNNQPGHTRTAIFTLPAGTTHGYFFTGTYSLHDYRDIITYWSHNGHSPTFFTEVKSKPGYTSLGVNSHFSPKEGNKYDLGRNDLRWNNIFLNNATFRNQPTIDSDERLKKDIEYDISIYDAIFDYLKPASFKLKDGTSGRTHLGIIAQDLKKTLDILGIDTKDFAGFIQAFKDPNVLLKKKQEELEDDDYIYGIRYNEVMMLMVSQIQTMKKEIKMLKDKLEIDSE